MIATELIVMTDFANDANALSLENESVHRVYDIIASHFSDTRYKVQFHQSTSLKPQPWPLVESFLRSLPPGSVGLDIGCGNGKYMGVNPDIFIIGTDRHPPFQTPNH